MHSSGHNCLPGKVQLPGDSEGEPADARSWWKGWHLLHRAQGNWKTKYQMSPGRQWQSWNACPSPTAHMEESIRPWRDGSSVKGSGCSSRGPRFNSQLLHGDFIHRCWGAKLRCLCLLSKCLHPPLTFFTPHHAILGVLLDEALLGCMLPKSSLLSSLMQMNEFRRPLSLTICMITVQTRETCSPNSEAGCWVEYGAPISTQVPLAASSPSSKALALCIGGVQHPMLVLTPSSPCLTGTG